MSLDFDGVRILCAVALPLLLGTPAQPPSGRPLHFMSKQCNEDAIRLRVDPQPFRELVGPRFSLALEEGKASLLVLAQDCSQYWLDGENYGATQEFHVWLSIDGAKDSRPVVGAQLTRPTMTWFRLFHGSTNARAREARMRTGSVETPISALVLDPPGPKRGGRASLSTDLAYSWRLVSAPPLARTVGVNHDVNNRTTAGDIVLDQIQALVYMTAAASPGTLEVAGSTEMLPWIRAGSHPISVNSFSPIWARGTFGVSTMR